MMHGWNPFMTFGSVWGVLWMLVLVALTVSAAVVLTRALLPGSEAGDRARHEDALAVLRARRARRVPQPARDAHDDPTRTMMHTMTTTIRALVLGALLAIGATAARKEPRGSRKRSSTGRATVP